MDVKVHKTEANIGYEYVFKDFFFTINIWLWNSMRNFGQTFQKKKILRTKPLND